MLFDSWQELGWTLLVGSLTYGALVVLLRLFGKRTLSKWNAFDFVVTVALGSSFATILLSKQVAFVQGLVAFGLLMGLQFIVTWLSVRSARVRRLVKAEPVLLLYQGQFREEAMRRERVTESEVLAALRGQGIGTVEQVAAVVLETDGSFSVVADLGEGQPTALADVTGIEARR